MGSGWCKRGVGGGTACVVYRGSALDASPAYSVFPHNKSALRGQLVSWLCIGIQSSPRGEEQGGGPTYSHCSSLVIWTKNSEAAFSVCFCTHLTQVLNTCTHILETKNSPVAQWEVRHFNTSKKVLVQTLKQRKTICLSHCDRRATVFQWRPNFIACRFSLNLLHCTSAAKWFSDQDTGNRFLFLFS